MSQQVGNVAGRRGQPAAQALERGMEPGMSAAPPQRLAALAGVKASVTVVAGTVQTTVGQILGLKVGEVLTLDRELNAPFDVVLSGSVIARGELVAVGDSIGLRITQVATIGQ